MNKGHISKLHLFAKDTDAPDVIKGFKYQELKTLEVWLYNRVNGIEEQIYCDFEDDIFQRDLKSFKSTFKQLKLYSSKNFSFSSDEIIKSLSHFFMLFVKGEYLLDDTLFIFETNTSIAGRRGDNDSELLEEWAKNQDNPSEELIEKCVIKLKSIIDTYIASQYEKLKEKKEPIDLILAKEIYESIPDETWKVFAESIRWVFDGISAEEAISSCVEKSLELISQLQFPLIKDEYSLVFDRLWSIVGDKSMQSEPEDRVLTNELLDKQLLSLGDKDDKVYGQSFEIWKDVIEIKHFNIGEFYQVLFTAKHCRRNDYLKDHCEIWINLLLIYTSLPDTLRKLKREAIYEILWLSYRPSVDELSMNSLKGLEELTYDYYSDFEEYEDVSSVEDALSLLSILATAQKLNLIDIDGDCIVEWFKTFDSFVEKCKSSVPNRDLYCNLLEVEGFSFLNKNSIGIGSNNMEKALKSFNEIIEELPNAPYYAVSQLGTKIDEIVNLAVRAGREDKVKELEKYSEDLLQYVKNREGDFSTAKRYLERGMNHLDSKNPKGILKALDFFQKAKDLYQNEDSNEGFVLGVMSISQLYSAIGMNIAAKYYSLSVIWFCFQQEDSQLYKRISESYSLLIHSDCKQGSWMSALQAFESYIAARTEFDPANFDLEKDELLRKTLIEEAFILCLTPIVSNQLSGFIEYVKIKMGNIYQDFLKDMVEVFERGLDTIGLNELITRKLENPPINDIGARRTITWKSFGSQWNVEFKNDFINNSVAEEFAALIQIIQAEIAIRDINFHLQIGSIQMQVELVKTPKNPEKLHSSSVYRWKVFLPVLNSKESSVENMHYASITAAFQSILSELSILSHDHFQKHFYSLFENGLATRTLVINAYQHLYRDLNNETEFNESRRDKFTSDIAEIEQKESHVLASKTNEGSL